MLWKKALGVAGLAAVLSVGILAYFDSPLRAPGSSNPTKPPTGGSHLEVVTGDLVQPTDIKRLYEGPSMQWQSKDLRSKNFTAVTNRELWSISFDNYTRWPNPNRLPKGFDPEVALEKGKDPGLGVRNLHKQGITGKGINVAVIDFPLLSSHREFEGRIRYNEVDPANPNAKRLHFHGPATASLLAGSTVGVVPEATLHYYAVPDSGEETYFPNVAKAIDLIIERNATLPESDRIRVISVSTGWKKPVFIEATQRAEAHGIAVVHCGEWFSVLYTIAGAAPDGDRNDPANYEASLAIKRLSPGHKTTRLHAPGDYRTTASNLGPDVYAYWGEGGLSWVAPYLAGLVAMGMQVNPDLAPADLYRALDETAIQTNAGLKLVNPEAFIAAVRRP